MRKVIFFILVFFISCTGIIYRHESEVDYDRYKSCYIKAIENNASSMIDPNYSGIYNIFIKQLAEKSDFEEIYNYKENDISVSDTTDCTIELVLTEFNDEVFDLENDEVSYKVKVKMKCRLLDITGKTILNWFTEDGKSERSDYDYFSIDTEATRKEAFEDVFNKITHRFLKDFEI
jgi:phosphoribosylformylglycinamidine (FGAM) synthase PurS component